MPQPQTANDRAALSAAILAALANVVPPLAEVVDGPPWFIAQDRECHVWYTGRGPTDEGTGFSDQSYILKFTVAVYWRMPPNAQTMSVLMAEAMDTDAAVATALEEHSLFGYLIENFHISASTAGVWTHFSGALMYALEIPVEMVCYGADLTGA